MLTMALLATPTIRLLMSHPPRWLVRCGTSGGCSSVTASGTATVQAALHDTPMVVVYRVSDLEFRLGRRFVKVDTFAMVNLLAGERIVPELIQSAFTPEAVAAEAVTLLTNQAASRQMRDRLGDVRRKLGGPGASRRAAAAILKVMGASCASS